MFPVTITTRRPGQRKENMKYTAEIIAFKTEAGRCAQCGKWFRELVGSCMDAMELPCGHTSVIGMHDGRPIGKKSKLWKPFCKNLKLDPKNPIWPYEECEDILNAWFVWRPIL